MAHPRATPADDYGKLVSAAQEIKHSQPPPTPPPVLFARHVGPRQVTTSIPSTFSLTLAPDSTCGFLSGSPGNPIVCPNRSTCTWEAEHLAAIICGTAEQNLNMYARCMPRTLALDPDICDDVCRSNSFNLLCTGTASPYCRTYAYPSGIIDFRCAASSVSTVQSVLHTYESQISRDFTTFVIDENGIISMITPTPRPAPTPTPAPTPAPSNPAGSTTSPGPSTSTNITIISSSSSSGPPVGPIVGGVIGGLALIGLFLLAGFFVFRRTRQNRHDSLVPAPGQHYAFAPGGHPSMQQQGFPPSTYDPSFKPGHGSITVSAVSPTSLGPENQGRISQGYPAGPPGYQPQGAPQALNATPPPASGPIYPPQPQGMGDQGLGQQPSIPVSAPAHIPNTGSNTVPQSQGYQQPGQFPGPIPPGGVYEIGTAGSQQGGIQRQ